MVALVPPSCAPGHSQYPGAQCSQVCGGNLLRTGLLCTPDNPCVTTTSWLNKTEVTPLIVLKRKREMALILQNSDLDEQKKRSQWSEWWWWGIQRVCLGLRVSGFGSYHFVCFEDEQEVPLLCGCLHSGPLSTGQYSLTVQGGWGAWWPFLSGSATCPCGCHSDSPLGLRDSGLCP